MRVLLVASTYHPVVGGAETYARLVAEGLAARGHEVVVFTDGSRVDAPADAVENGVRVVRARRYAELLDRPDLVRWEQLQYALLDELAAASVEPDLVHANSMEAAVLGSMVALDRDVPLVGTFHEQAPEDAALGRGRTRLTYGLLPLDCVLAGSRFYAEKAVAGGAGDRVRLVYHGVDAARFARADPHAARERFGVPHEAFTVAFAGRFSPRKGARDLIAASARVRARVPGLRVLLAGSCNSGSTEYRDAMLADVEAFGLAGVVSVHEDLGIDDVPALFAAADVVAQPSYAEGLGLAMIEAMAAGRPVVTTDIDGVREVVTNGIDGVLVPPGDIDAVAREIGRLHDDPATATALAERAVRTVHERFSYDRMLDEIEAAYAAVRIGT
jgi:glycosyltransferase involved in cell wall biosynthesis